MAPRGAKFDLWKTLCLEETKRKLWTEAVERQKQLKTFYFSSINNFLFQIKFNFLVIPFKAFIFRRAVKVKELQEFSTRIRQTTSCSNNAD